MKEEQQIQTIWIEAEEWAPGEWNPQDDNTDVIVTLEDGSRWAATFFTYRNVQTLTDKNKTTGECLAGAYFWSSNMVIIDEVSRQRIEAVIGELLKEKTFETVFSHLP
jgi:hypothetical protein